MKLSGRETALIVILSAAILFMVYYFLLLSPAQDRMAEKSRELNTVREEKLIMDAIIAASEGLSEEQEEIEDDIKTMEQSLLPVINSEAIARRLQQMFIDNNIPFFMSVSTDSVEYFRTMLPDNTYSPNIMEMVRFNFTVSGSDGVLLTTLDDDDDDPTLVGYDEFINSVKAIEDDYPESVRIHSIEFEDTNQGFMLFSVSVDVFAFSLPSRLSGIDQTADFIRWEGTDLETINFSGTVGIPFESVPETDLSLSVDRPYSKYPVNTDMLLGLATDFELEDVENDSEDE